MRKIIARIFLSCYIIIFNVYGYAKTVTTETQKKDSSAETTTQIFQAAKRYSTDTIQPLDRDNPYLLVPQHLVKRFYFTGSVRVTGFASNHTPTTVGMIPSYAGRSPSATDLNLSTAILAANIELTDWISSVISMAYQQNSPSFVRSPLGGGDTFIVDRAYVKFADKKITPAMLTVGRLFIPFGGIDTSSYLASPVQLLSLNRETIVSLGFENWHNLSAQIYGFRGLRDVNSQNDTQTNSYGTQISYEPKLNEFTYKLGVGFLNDITSVLYTRSTVAINSPLADGFFNRAVKGLDLNAAIAWRSFDASIKYIAALNSFSVIDLPITTDGGQTFKGATPSGWDLNLGYQFPVIGHTTRLGMGYQASKEAVSIGKAPASTPNNVPGPYGNFFAIGIPYQRYYVNYNVNIIDRADVAFELAYDKGYGSQFGGTGRGAYTGLVVLTVSK